MSESAQSEKTSFPYMQNRELSWLEFNKRVLDQSTDDTVPLLDQLNFISIFASNLSEFFMVRVGSIADLSLVKKSIIDRKSGMTPSQQLDAIYERCHELYPYYAQCFQNASRKLTAYGIYNLKKNDLTEEQMEFVADYFYDNVMPFLSPQIVNSRHPFPHLENGSLYIVVRLDEQAQSAGKKKKGEKTASNVAAEGVTLGLIPLPRQCERLVLLPESVPFPNDINGTLAEQPTLGCEFMLLEHVIEMFCEEIFSMYKVKHTNIICVTRNADLDATEGAEEQGEDYREHMKRILRKRARLAPVRLESERELSPTVKSVLLERLDLKEHQLFVLPIPLDLSYVEDISECIDSNLNDMLTAPPFEPQWPSSLNRNRSIIEQINERDILLSYPYETMDAFLRLLREAVRDPRVISIKITLYRLANQSHLAEMLLAAAEAGKEVTAIFELRARFDESNNIEWSQRFEQAGCHVLYGFREYKIHSKICCITYQSSTGVKHITQLGTGNYNEKTARLYTDFCFMTTDDDIGRDAMAYFRNVALENVSNEYETLWVSPLQIKHNILNGIDEQIKLQQQGMPTGLFFKTNSVTDKDIICKIVEASQAGVKCTLLVRGVSCLVPGIEGYTDNVCVVSIVGRLLEHSRIYCFGPLDGDVKVYLSSADLMTRNMDKRVEIAWPVLDPQVKNEVIGYIGTCMSDTAKLRDLLPNKEYTPLRYFAQEDPITGELILFNSQEFLIAEAQRKHLEAITQAVSYETGEILGMADNESFSADEAIDDAYSGYIGIPEFNTMDTFEFAPVSEPDYAAPIEYAQVPDYQHPIDYTMNPEFQQPAEFMQVNPYAPVVAYPSDFNPALYPPEMISGFGVAVAPSPAPSAAQSMPKPAAMQAAPTTNEELLPHIAPVVVAEPTTGTSANIAVKPAPSVKSNRAGEDTSAKEKVILGYFGMKEPKLFSRTDAANLDGIPNLLDLGEGVLTSNTSGVSSSAFAEDDFSTAQTILLNQPEDESDNVSVNLRTTERHRKPFNMDDDIPSYDSIEAFFNKAPELNEFVIPRKKSIFGRPEY